MLKFHPTATTVPQAPSHDAWLAMTPTERQTVVDSLPSTVPASEAAPPQGDPHGRPIEAARDALEGWFRTQGRGVYVGADLMVYYPEESYFAPDLFVVMDVEPHDRMKWVVNNEGKGLDWVLEVLCRGSWRKDLISNLARFARLGIPEYFVYDRRQQMLHAWSLPAGGDKYQRVLPQGGRFPIRSLGLSVAIEGERLRFYTGTAPVPQTIELVERLTAHTDALSARAQALNEALEEGRRKLEEEQRKFEEGQRKLEEEQRKLEEERHKREAAEKRLIELEALLKERP